jgi:hypothetical protein
MNRPPHLIQKFTEFVERLPYPLQVVVGLTAAPLMFLIGLGVLALVYGLFITIMAQIL